MKVLFLDIDEVLTSRRTIYAFNTVPRCSMSNAHTQLDSISLALINKIEKKGVKIVLSSTWRIGHTVEEASKALSIPLFDKTGRCSTGFRGNEIKEWLDNNPEVTHYVILDDSSDFLSEQKKFHVKTNYRNGVLAHHYEKMCKLLKIDLW